MQLMLSKFEVDGGLNLAFQPGRSVPIPFLIPLENAVHHAALLGRSVVVTLL